MPDSSKTTGPNKKPSSDKNCKYPAQETNFGWDISFLCICKKKTGPLTIYERTGQSLPHKRLRMFLACDENVRAVVAESELRVDGEQGFLDSLEHRASECFLRDD